MTYLWLLMICSKQLWSLVMLDGLQSLTHWGRVTHICVGNFSIIGSDNGLSPGRRQAIIWNNAVISLIGPFGTNLSEILIGIQTFSFKKLHLKTSSAKWRLFCLGLNELTLLYAKIHIWYTVHQVHSDVLRFWLLSTVAESIHLLYLKAKVLGLWP